jgi:hypothetical protein
MYTNGDGPSLRVHDENSWLFQFLSVLLRESCSQQQFTRLTTLREIEIHLITYARRNDFQSVAAERNLHLPEKIAGTKWESAIARHLEYYRDNPRRFALDLRPAVIRQGGFVDKMHTLLWIRAPSLPHTMVKSLDRYQKFLHLMGARPDQRVVPTLDVDLVWHTHQLCPPHYNYATLRDTGRFINHDDRMAAMELNASFHLSQQLWVDTFGECYGGCLCWQCEQYSAMLSDLVEQSLGRASCGEWAWKDFQEAVLASGRASGWSDQTFNPQRRAQVLQKLSEQEYAAFVVDVRITTKWHRDVELGRLARIKGENVPGLSLLGLSEVRRTAMSIAAGPVTY